MLYKLYNTKHVQSKQLLLVKRKEKKNKNKKQIRLKEKQKEITPLSI